MTSCCLTCTLNSSVASEPPDSPDFGVIHDHKPAVQLQTGTTITVTVAAKGNGTYNSGSKTVTITVK
jgi:hypothetical protein